MRRRSDVSIHFQTKTQTVKEIDEKLDAWFSSSDYQEQFDFSEPSFFGVRNTLHHCFIHEGEEKTMDLPTRTKEIIANTHEFLGRLSENIVQWKGVSFDGIEWDRRFMLENIEKLNGHALFIGEIIDGVKQEYDEALRLKVDCILIP